MTRYTIFLGIIGAAIYLTGCSGKANTAEMPEFTKLDSLTERYLDLQDSMLYAWNIMLNDDNNKFRSMHSLLDKLGASNHVDQEELIALEHRLQELSTTPLDPDVIDESVFIEEYDFATNHLIQELTTLASSHPSFSHRDDLRNLIEEITAMDQRVSRNRSNYDAMVSKYNTFLDRNKTLVKEIDEDIAVVKKPLFSMTAEN